MGSMKKQTMDEKIGVRIPTSWKLHLEELTKQRPPGTKISDLAREAIYQVFFSTPTKKKNGGGGGG